MMRGRRQIRSRRFDLRRALCMDAMAAKRHNPLLIAFYERLIAAARPLRKVLVRKQPVRRQLAWRAAGSPSSGASAAITALRRDDDDINMGRSSTGFAAIEVMRSGEVLEF